MYCRCPYCIFVLMLYCCYTCWCVDGCQYIQVFVTQWFISLYYIVMCCYSYSYNVVDVIHLVLVLLCIVYMIAFVIIVLLLIYALRLLWMNANTWHTISCYYWLYIQRLCSYTYIVVADVIVVVVVADIVHACIVSLLILFMLIPDAIDVVKSVCVWC